MRHTEKGIDMFHLLPNAKPSSLLLTIGCFSAGIAGILFWHHDRPARTPVKPALAQAVRPQPLTPPQPELLFDVQKAMGSYYFGDGLGVNCTLGISGDHRFQFQWQGCLGVYDTNSGSWEMQGDVLVCKPEHPNKQQGFAGMNLRFIPVQWGKRYYLVEENEMPGFCAGAASGSIPNTLDPHGHDYVQWGRTAKPPPVQGKPLLPTRYQTFYTQGAIQAKVISIDPTQHVTLNKGRTERIEPGMLLAADSDSIYDVKILSSAEHTSLAEVQYYWNSGVRIKRGDKLTTGSSWNRPHGTKFKIYSDLPELLQKKRTGGGRPRRPDVRLCGRDCGDHHRLPHSPTDLH